MIKTQEFFWWKLESVFFKELEESLIWRLETLGIKSFSIEELPNNSSDQKLVIWLPSNEWSVSDRASLESSLCLLVEVFEKKLLDFDWEKIIDEDWSSSWKKMWRPDPIGEKLLVLPSWLKLPELYSQRIILHLDPGSAFGTGSHPTTRLCLEALERYPPTGKIVADIGCGSGILGIAALALGAKSVKAVDLDPLAVKATYENALKNNLNEKQLMVSEGSIDLLEEQMHFQKFDLLLCNILSHVIKRLAPDFAKITSQECHIVLSGLLVDQVEDITKTLSLFNWELVASHECENWALIYLCKHTPKKSSYR